MMLVRDRRYTAQDGLSLFYRDFGDAAAPATPVVCLPGLTRNGKDFVRLAERLAAERRVLCPDLRGRGQSAHDPDPARYRPDIYVGDVLHLLAATGTHRAVVVGTSLGGIIAMGIAIARPTVLAGVLLNDIGPEIDPAGMKRIGTYVGATPSFTNWAEAVAHYRARYSSAYPALSASGWEALARNATTERQGRIVFDYDPNIAQPMASAGAPANLWPAFAALQTVPTTVLRGALSDILSSSTVERMRALKPDLDAVEVPKLGHVPLLDEVESLGAIDRLLARVDHG
ncbi:MAG: alpha/beta hydrolase [Alphaproteobacteria bacterium]|nr:alpha/beta hydrolase [Alphaproteobacteria bacterium]